MLSTGKYCDFCGIHITRKGSHKNYMKHPFLKLCRSCWIFYVWETKLNWRVCFNEFL